MRARTTSPPRRTAGTLSIMTDTRAPPPLSWPDVPRPAFGPGAETQLNAVVSSALWTLQSP